MAYDDKRSYLQMSIPAQNVIHTASNHLATSTLNAFPLSIAEATFLTSIAVTCTASSGNQVPVGLLWRVLQTNTTSIGQLVTSTQTLNQLSSASFTPPVGIPANTWLNFVAIGTGTASETRTASAINITLGISPQYV